MNYLLHILVMIDIYVILALSLNLLVGYTGLLSICHAAFYGIGAYITALLMVEMGWGFFAATGISALGTALLSFTISVPSLRLKGDHFVLASLGFQIIVFTVLYNWTGLTKGPYGIPGIPQPEIFGYAIDEPSSFFLFSFVIAAICAALLYYIGESPFGRVLRTIRDDEIAAESLGKNPARFKIVAFAVAAAFAAVAGSLFATYMQYIDPTSFKLLESIFILSLVIIGGAGNLVGPVVGAVTLVVLPEALRFVGMPDAIAANMRQIIYGLLLIVMMRFRPQGFFGNYRFS